jgi:hypothetical protein
VRSCEYRSGQFPIRTWRLLLLRGDENDRASHFIITPGATMATQQGSLDGIVASGHAAKKLRGL